MFKIEDINPVIYRKKTRNATIKIMLMFIIIGFTTASLFLYFFGEYSNSKLVLNLLGGLLGLAITGYIIKVFFADKPWMHESMYAWRLKRSLMHITNVEHKIREAVEKDDIQALKILRFYHIGLEQMYTLENNSSAQVDIVVEKHELKERLKALNIDTEQTSFDPEWVKVYKEQK